MWRPRPRTQPPPPARRVAPTQQRERWVGLMTPAPARPQSCKHEKEAAEEVEEKVVVTSFKTKQKHGMEVMMRAGSTGFGVGVGYHYSVKFTAKSTVDTSKEDPDDYANACGDLTEMGCNACIGRHTTLHVKRVLKGKLGRTGDHPCRWWMPKKGGPGYCSMWDHKDATEVADATDCNWTGGGVGPGITKDMLEREE